MKSKVDQLDVDKLAPVLADLSKLSDVAENAVVKRDVCDATITNIEDKMPDITNLLILVLKIKFKKKYLVLLSYKYCS